MRTIKLYHGTNATNLKDLLDSPRATSNINGLGFYTSLDLEVAKKYGRTVVCWELDMNYLDGLDSVSRPIDQRYTEELASYDECAKGGMEIVLTQRAASLMAIYAEDATVVWNPQSV